jgi:hypothetical protein
MKISKVVRRKSGSAVSALNAVVTANVGETDQETSAGSRQHVEIIQRDGHTEVREHSTDDKE